MELSDSFKKETRNDTTSPHNARFNQSSLITGQKTESPPRNEKKPLNPSLSKSISSEKNIMGEIIRIRGQEKLLYQKQCKLKKLTIPQVFQHYPYCKMEAYEFDIDRLRDESGKFTAQIIENQDGVHLVESYARNQHKYKHKYEDERDDVFNGLGVSLFNDGRIFEGMYHDSRQCGVGYELSPNGNTYIGMFREGLKHGQGVFYWFANNEVYNGSWLGGLPHGEGILEAQDKYEGNFSNGLKYGDGEEWFSNGDHYVGQYVNNIADGYGEYFWADGSHYKGDFKHGVRHGYGIWQDKHEAYKGSYRMDKKEGFGIYKWVGKQIYKGEFKEDFREGYGQFYSLHADVEKLLYKGCWLKGQRHEEGKVNEEAIRQLLMFLDETHRFQKQIEENATKPKKRAGHKNCVPHS